MYKETIDNRNKNIFVNILDKSKTQFPNIRSQAFL